MIPDRQHTVLDTQDTVWTYDVEKESLASHVHGLGQRHVAPVGQGEEWAVLRVLLVLGPARPALNTLSSVLNPTTSLHKTLLAY